MKNLLKTQPVEKDEDYDAGRVDVAILMCTYNGATYLREQLESFRAQSFQNWTLYVSDDASTDATRSILTDYRRRWGEHKVVIFNGPCQGFGKNFISLLKRQEIQAHYYAFSDQDDVWFSDKLERSVKRLEAITEKTPGLYCSRTRLIDATGRVIGFSPLFPRLPSFRNALVQSIAGANTMLVNHAARQLLMLIPDDAKIVAHDWLTYIIVTACGGEACYDGEPSLDYRQHSGNLIGANSSFSDRITRLRKMLSGRFSEWNDTNVQILKDISHCTNEDSQAALQHFASGRKMKLPGRLCELYKSGIYRQTASGNISLILAALLKRM
ncbi:Group 2 family glycosyl transferase [Pseudomonas amygdali pv. lachrymans]|uniref:Group 2 family glycosyl transferase n=3 Tax=Pseudomonas syringae group TaxID=136849 RepID=A0A0Q0BU62_PSEAJ|nr:Group 2 family glycosyl transferase [Pseudomonas amygdali pv. lachrymans]KPY78769.1 Group 2 family glycosyl transferase [Pseudomonas amygdali pv. tabaci]RMR56999.1 Group 2 family glycosyl transferase [Pseudomonas syringae pv. actinidiae]KPC20619.1 Group 2 family glycosyl transferase [Pseudomonas amygdali pv. lachrymans]KPX71784.1 Group 2 family glycosyl transferase [Pseudomonas amygdali pv. lachrymans]